MAGRGRGWWGVGLLGALACAGCDPGTLAYFMMPEPKEAAELRRLASDDKKKEVKVVILTYPAMEPQADLIQVDRQLTEVLARQMTELFKDNEEKVTVVSPRRVEDYKNQHPSRRGLDPLEVGQHFKADYVIYLEIVRMSLYEPGAGQQLLRGRAHISVSLVDVNHPDDTEEPREFTHVYPSDSMGPKAVDADTPPAQFRQQFLASIAHRLSYYFAPHPKRDRSVQMDP
jgi:hypothetical protein